MANADMEKALMQFGNSFPAFSPATHGVWVTNGSAICGGFTDIDHASAAAAELARKNLLSKQVMQPLAACEAGAMHDVTYKVMLPIACDASDRFAKAYPLLPILNATATGRTGRGAPGPALSL